MLTFYPSRILDQGVKKAPDPRSRIRNTVYRVRLCTVLDYADVITLGWRSLVTVFEKLKLRQFCPPKVWNKRGEKIDNKKVMEPLFGDSQNLTSSGKPCVRPLKKLPYKVYIFLVFYDSKKYFKGALFSLKMWYLIKQGQQASSKIWKYPDEVITRWRSYTIWR